MAKRLLRKFWQNRRGNFALATVITAVPLCGAIGLAVDYAEMSRQRQVTLNALDAAGIATARRLVSGVTDQQAKDYAQDFFNANLGAVKDSIITLTVTLPNSNTGGGTLKLAANLKYKPYFMSGFRKLLGQNVGDGLIPYNAQTEIRLKNTLEVALVLDNSGSMDEKGKGSSKSRMELLKDAAGEMIKVLVADAQQIKQVSEPVRISVVPFAGSVNVKTTKPDGTPDTSEPWMEWMDTTGISPIHHENFDWATMTLALNPNKYAQKSGSVWYAKGSEWGTDQQDKPLTRFSLYKGMQRISGKTTSTKRVCTLAWNGYCFAWANQTTTEYTYAPLAPWSGCVESRPSPYNVNDAAATTGTPATLFVPMFAPDEAYAGAEKIPYNNWMDDGIVPAAGTIELISKIRQRFMPKYFNTGSDVSDALGTDKGPNLSCTTTPITPLTDVTNSNGRGVIEDAIEAMKANGSTNVPEGMAWGWRTVSSTAPFDEGRAETEKGNDKVVIVLTDGENTYYTPGSLDRSDNAGNKSIYSSMGYARLFDDSAGRIFGGTSSDVSKGDFSNANYTKAMNEQFATLCNNAKAAGVTVMTVALDLNSADDSENAQITALKECASESRYRKDPDDPKKKKMLKLFMNSTSSTLTDDFKELAKELSNLRIVG